MDAHINGVAVMPKGKIYLSSLKNPQLVLFREVWGSRLDIEVLTEQNCEAVLSGKAEGTLVYDQDVFPDGNKISVTELWQRFYQMYLNAMMHGWYVIRDRWASIREKDVDDLSKFVAAFDAGHEAVYIVDDDGRYLGTVSVTAFRRVFPKPECTHFVKKSAPYTGKQDEDMRNIVLGLDGTGEQEIALLRNDRIAAIGCHIVDAISGDRFEVMQKQRVYWRLIDDDVAQSFFCKMHRVMISSDCGDLQGFREQFGRYLDIVVYDGSNIDQYMEGEVELLIYGDALWPSIGRRTYRARQLYNEMLAESLRRYFVAQGITYYSCNISKTVQDQPHRLAAKPTTGEPTPPFVWTGVAEDYLAFRDNLDPRLATVIDGHRQDAPHVDNPERSIFIYGPCTIFGSGAKFGETIGARIQEYCTNHGKRWRVVNCGGGGLNYAVCDLGSLHAMMHTPMRRGDIVIQCNGFLQQGSPIYQQERIYTSSDAFDDAEHLHGKYFWDANFAGHLTVEGYAVWGKFWGKELLKDSQLAASPSSRAYVAPYFHRMGDLCAAKPEMRDYLQRLTSHRHASNGSIAMNATPLTLGHLYLVETARKQVDFLYVFVVEENASAIPFADRFAMVQANCAGMDHVEVLPSGNYMISTMTFPEYFEKDERQDVKIVPSKDVRLFGEAIAPTLGIVKRFVGEEPFDAVTRQYNDAMKKMLPDYGVEVVEIPRKTAADGQAINATQVRSWMKAGNWEACKAYLPEPTLAYLKEHGIQKVLPDVQKEGTSKE